MNASRFPIQCITKEPSNGKRGSVFAFLQETNGVVQKDHDVFLNDLEYDGVDPLGASALQNAQSESGIVAEDKWYSYEKKKLSSSSPLRIVDYFDPSFDYVNENKKYRELLTEVNKELEYKSEKKGDAGKKKGRWGSKSKKAEERASSRAETVANGVAESAKPAEFVFQGKTAAQLHQEALAQAATAPDNAAVKKVVRLTAPGESVGRTAAPPEGAWSDTARLKLYVVPLGVHLAGQYAVGAGRAREA